GGRGGSGRGGGSCQAPPNLVAKRTRWGVRTLRRLGTMPGPAWAAVHWLWGQSCRSYPGRQMAPRALHQWVWGGGIARARAWVGQLLFLLAPNINYRKLTPPFGIDPAEPTNYNQALKPWEWGRELSSEMAPPGRGKPVHPLQKPWYEGPMPDRE
ncbi:unnamed protein product, partial [Discosporangium mesarthrocarpum]